MSTVTDSGVYTSKYLTCNDTTRNCLKKTVTIPGEAGKQIKVEEFGIQILNEKAGVNSTATISIESGGKETKVAAWMYSKAEFLPKTYKFSYLAAVGADVIIRLYLKTANAAYQARVKDFSYTYSFEGEAEELSEEESDTEPEESEEPEEDTPTLIVISCTSESEAEALLETLKTTTQNATIYKSV